MERYFEKFLIGEGWETVPRWECLYLLRTLKLFLSVYVDDMKTARKTQNMPKMWATLQKKVDLDDPVSLLDPVYLGCTQRAAQVDNRIVMDKQNCSRSSQAQIQMSKQRRHIPKTSQLRATTWKVTLESVWNAAAGWRTRR